MVWIKPQPPNEKENDRWFTLNRNDFFQLQVSDSEGKDNKLQYRILFKMEDVSVEKESLIVAEDQTEPAVCEDWLYIERTLLRQLVELKKQNDMTNILPFIAQQFSMLYMNALNAKDIAFSKKPLLVREKAASFDHGCLSIPEEKQLASSNKEEFGFEEEQRTRRSNSIFEVRSLPNIVVDEEILSTIECSKWMRVVYRKGALYVCCSKIIFLMPGNTEGDVIRIPFRSITSITKETTRLVKKDSLKVITNDGEDHYFAGMPDRDQAYELLAELWNMSMEKRLKDISAEKERLPMLDSVEGLGDSGTLLESDKEEEEEKGNALPEAIPVSGTGGTEPGVEAKPSVVPPLRIPRKRSGGEDAIIQSEGLPTSFSDSKLDEEDSQKARMRSHSDPKVLRSAVSEKSLFTSPTKQATKQMLDTKKKNEQFQALFGLPSDEELVAEAPCYLKVRSSEVRGNFFMSHNYACFRSAEALDDIGSTGGRRRSLSTIVTEYKIHAQTVIPFVFIVNIVCEDVDAVVVHIHTRQNKFLIQFPAVTSYIKLVALWRAVNGDTKHDIKLPAILSKEALKSSQESPQVLKSIVSTPTTPRGRSSTAKAESPSSPRGMVSPRAHDGSAISTTQWLNSSSEFSAKLADKEADLFLGKEVDWTDMAQWRSVFGDEFLGDADIGTDLEKEAQWALYFSEYGSDIDMFRTAEFYRLVLGGVPNRLRVKIWQICSGSIYRLLGCRKSADGKFDQKKPKELHSYEELWKKSQGKRSLASKEIEKDLGRSFNHPYYLSVEQGGDGASIDALRRVLTAFSWLNPEIGYCQSMNIVAAGLLLFLSEEQAFWLLNAIVTESLRGYYTKDMLGSMVDQRVFEVILQSRLGRVFKHINDKLSIPIAWFTLPWFLCLFIGKLPLKCVLRILDCFFFEGVSVLFQVSLALFHLAEERIMATTQEDDASGEILDFMRNMVSTKEGGDMLFTIAFKKYGDVTMDKIKELRNLHKLQVILEIEEDRRKEMEWAEKEREKEREQGLGEVARRKKSSTIATVNKSLSLPILPNNEETRTAAIKSSMSVPIARFSHRDEIIDEESLEESGEMEIGALDSGNSSKYNIYSIIDVEDLPRRRTASFDTTEEEDDDEVVVDEEKSSIDSPIRVESVASQEESDDEGDKIKTSGEVSISPVSSNENTPSQKPRRKQSKEGSRRLKKHKHGTDEKKKKKHKHKKEASQSSTSAEPVEKREPGHKKPKTIRQKKSRTEREKEKEKEKETQKESHKEVETVQPQQTAPTPEPYNSTADEELGRMLEMPSNRRASLRLRISDVQALKNNGIILSPTNSSPAFGSLEPLGRPSNHTLIQNALMQRDKIEPPARGSASAPSSPVTSSSSTKQKQSASSGRTSLSLKSFLFGRSSSKPSSSKSPTTKVVQAELQRKNTC